MARKRNKNKNRKAKPAGYMIGGLNFGSLNLSGNQTADVSKLEKPFRLLSLPSELFLKVLEYAVVDSTFEKPIRVGPGACGLSRKSSLEHTENEHEQVLQPAVTRTCRLLRLEGLKLFYGKNHFFTVSFEHDLQAIYYWLRKLSEQHRQMLRSLLVGWVYAGGPDTLQDQNGWDFQDEIKCVFGRATGLGLDPSVIGLRCEAGNIVLWKEDTTAVEWRKGPVEVMYQVTFQPALLETEAWTPVQEILDVTVRDDSKFKEEFQDFWVSGEDHCLKP